MYNFSNLFCRRTFLSNLFKNLRRRSLQQPRRTSTYLLKLHRNTSIHECSKCTFSLQVSLVNGNKTVCFYFCRLLVIQDQVAGRVEQVRAV